LSVNHETLRQWVRRAETDARQRPGLTTDERARMRELERENKELRRANEILKSAAVVFGTELDRRQARRGLHRHEPGALRGRAGLQGADRARLQDRPEHLLGGQVPASLGPGRARRAAQGGGRPCAPREPGRCLRRRQGLGRPEPGGHQGPRCTVERLVRELGLSGARRGKAFRVTTRSDKRQHRPADLVERRFKAPAPNRLWVANLTYVKTHSGGVYAAFVIDVFSPMVVGWQTSVSLRSDLAIDALEMAVWKRTRAGNDLGGLVHHSDSGVQYLSVRHSERLAGNDIVASVGSRGDSYDNAMAEAFNSLYKWELIYRQGPWKDLDDVEFAGWGYVDWFNHRRLHGEITDDSTYTTPAESEALYYRQNNPALEAGTQ